LPPPANEEHFPETRGVAHTRSRTDISAINSRLYEYELCEQGARIVFGGLAVVKVVTALGVDVEGKVATAREQRGEASEDW